MLFYLIFIILLLASLVGMLYIVLSKYSLLKSLPRYPEVVVPGHNSFFVRLFRKIKEVRYTKFQASIFAYLEKILRQLKIFILKIDHLFTKYLARMKERSHVFNIRSKAWMVKKHIEDEKEKSEIEQIAKEQIIKNDDVSVIIPEEVSDIILQSEIVIETSSVEEEEEILPEEKKLIDIIAKHPKDIKAYRDLANLYIRRKNIKDAKAALRQILKIDPEDESARKELEQLI